ncbi:hypothetical protein [Stygiolobus caldivivus]|nr:hypothetical protein [Stygiolobus caldivivus]
MYKNGRSFTVYDRDKLSLGLDMPITRGSAPDGGGVRENFIYYCCNSFLG